MAARGSGQKLQRSSSGGRQTNQPLCRYLRGSAISALGESRSRRVVLLFLSRSGRAYNDLSAQTYQDLTRRASSGESRVPSPAFLPPTAFFFLSQPLRVALLPGSSSSYHLCIGYDTATRRLRTQRRDFEIDFEAAAQRSERRSRLALLLYPARSLLYFQHAVSSFTFSLRSTPANALSQPYHRLFNGVPPLHRHARPLPVPVACQRRQHHHQSSRCRCCHRLSSSFDRVLVRLRRHRTSAVFRL